jgi:hypothetical protein
VATVIDTSRRTILAVVASALGAAVGIAGVGHAYLREWRRAAAWFALVVGSALVLLAVFTDPATVDPRAVPREVTLPLVVLFALSTLDAYVVAVRSADRSGTDAGDDGGPACPYCGKELDPDLSFCPWCTERLPAPEEATSR